MKHVLYSGNHKTLMTSQNQVQLLRRARQRYGQPNEVFVAKTDEGRGVASVFWNDENGEIEAGTILNWACYNRLLAYIKNSAKQGGVFWDCEVTIL